MKKEHPIIGIVTIPISEANLTPLSNLVDILSSFSSKVCLITGGAGYTFFKGKQKVELYGVGRRPKPNTFGRVMKYIPTQLSISYKLARVSANTNLWIFFIGGPALLLPILSAKLFGKKVVLACAGSDIESIRAQDKVLSKPVELLVKLGLTLSDEIIIYSPNLIKEWNLEKYRNKISIAHKHFLDFSKFKVGKPLEKRDNLIGYIGRLSEEKGILSFMEAIPKALEREDSVEILIGGDGQLRGKVERYLNEQNLNNKVKFVGWIPHDELPKYLNELKLLVLPSYTEGLPNIMLEAMACGTPVLATPVGAVPDVIKDGETGFIMEDNLPETIAQGISRALNCPNLEQIGDDACALVKKEFTFEAALEGYRDILRSLSETLKWRK